MIVAPCSTIARARPARSSSATRSSRIVRPPATAPAAPAPRRRSARPHPTRRRASRRWHRAVSSWWRTWSIRCGRAAERRRRSGRRGRATGRRKPSTSRVRATIVPVRRKTTARPAASATNARIGSSVDPVPLHRRSPAPPVSRAAPGARRGAPDRPRTGRRRRTGRRTRRSAHPGRG